MFASSECIKASSSNEFKFMIITSPTSTYYNQDLISLLKKNTQEQQKEELDLLKQLVIMPSLPYKDGKFKGFQQVIWTDSSKHQFIEECGTMNIWFE